MDKVVITGGSGMLGRALLARYANVHPVTAISRSEKLQLPLRAQYPQVTFLLGDIRDRAFLARACEGASVILHAAALKHVPLSELEPTAYISVNVHGSLQVLDVAHAVGAKVVGISTDKACAPRNVYGASKFLMERMLVEQGHVAIRYGNVFASDGSVVVRWTQQLQEVGTITVTDPEMTRFFFRIGDAVDAIDWAWHTAPAGTVVVPFLRAVRLGDLAAAILAHAGKGDLVVIGPREGEKPHESLITADEGEYASPLDGYVLLHRQRQTFSMPAMTSNDAARIPQEELVSWMAA
jgi:UDP-N-acetylglucosamine 4,6-dehydratase